MSEIQGRCETCRFWARKAKPSYSETTSFLERSGADIRNWHDCNRQGDLDARFAASASDDYDLALVTAPDFGCTEYQPQP